MARILVIEDDDGVRSLVRDTLSRVGHSVIEASNGKAGLALVRREPIDVILTDLFMPESDGLEVVMAVKSQFPAVPVIAMSGVRDNRTLYLKAAEQLGARSTLQKPFNPSQLLAAVNAVLDSKGQARTE